MVESLEVHVELTARHTMTLATLATLGLSATCCFADYADAERAYQKGDFAAAYRQYRELAEAGDVRAQGTVACMIQMGEGVSRDPAGALPWYLKAGEQGLEPAQMSLARAFESGVGTERDLAQALVWYGKAAQKGNPEAQASYQRLQALREDAATAAPAPVPAPAAAAVAGAAAAAAPARAPETGAVVAPAPAAKAAPAPAPAASHAKETMPELALGNPVGESAMPELALESALTRKMRAAEDGDVNAQVFVGWSYSSGRDVPQDKAEAVKWYKLAGLAGDVRAQLALGWLYFSGDCGRRDLEEAAYWYGKAAGQGNQQAKKMLKRLPLRTTSASAARRGPLPDR